MKNQSWQIQNRQIAKSPNRQIAKSPIRQIIKSLNSVTLPFVPSRADQMRKKRLRREGKIVVKPTTVFYQYVSRMEKSVI
jgi:hypothetical protein